MSAIFDNQSVVAANCCCPPAAPSCSRSRVYGDPTSSPACAHYFLLQQAHQICLACSPIQANPHQIMHLANPPACMSFLRSSIHSRFLSPATPSGNGLLHRILRYMSCMLTTDELHPPIETPRYQVVLGTSACPSASFFSRQRHPRTAPPKRTGSQPILACPTRDLSCY